jgi:long-chain acyl-CoA synthetase
MINLDTRFRETTRRQPDHAALLGPRAVDRTTYRELDAAIDRAARRLARAGVRPGFLVGLHYASGHDYIVYNYAAWRLGAAVVPIPIELHSAEKQDIARRIYLDFLISEKRRMTAVEALCAGSRAEVGPQAVVAPVWGQPKRPAAVDQMNCAFIRFTSGTTAASKGVVLSHETICDRIQAANDALGITPTDRIVWVLSMSYHFAVSIAAYLSYGATIVLPANAFAPAMLAASQQHQATIIYASPTHYAWLADCPLEMTPGARPIPSLRLAISTTASLDVDTARKFERHFQLAPAQALGIIEVGLPFINCSFAAAKPESVGPALPAYEVKLRDVGLGPRHQEILLRGRGMLDAYYQPWQTRDEILDHGWFHTGDVGELDSDGCLFLRGRAKDVISVMGMKFFPQEVEAVLAAHPSVQQASVFAAADERFGEAAWACVVPRAGAPLDDLEQELREFCRDRMADYKVPEHIELVTAIPRTPSGKVVRRVLAS